MYNMLKYCITFVLFTIHLDTSFAYPRNANYHRRELVISNEFEILVLSQLWPQTSCWDVNEFWNRTFECSPCAHLNPSNNWTLHGLWPSNKHGGSPEHCNHDMKFRLANLDEDLRVLLNDKWHSSKVGKRNAEFWKHEWEKHGTCSLELENTGSMNNYFNHALFLLDHHNVGQILSDHDITPGKDYGVMNIYDAIHSSLNVRPFIMCARNPNTKQQFLHQINVCFDKTFTLVDCKDEDNLTNCSQKKAVTYPVNLPYCY